MVCLLAGLAIGLPLALVPIITLVCLCVCVKVRKNKKTHWTAQSNNNELAPPPDNTGSPPSNTDWDLSQPPPALRRSHSSPELPFSPASPELNPPDSSSAFSPSYSHERDLPPAYETVNTAFVDMSQDDVAPPPTYEALDIGKITADSES